jgi:hypothetical protein
MIEVEEEVASIHTYTMNHGRVHYYVCGYEGRKTYQCPRRAYHGRGEQKTH